MRRDANVGALGVLLLLALHTAADAKHLPRPLAANAKDLAKSAAKTHRRRADIDLDRLLKATDEFLTLLADFGKFVKPSVAEVRSCLRKLDEGRRNLSLGAKQRRSLRCVLEAERAMHIHGRGGVLADPSCAMGALWVRRGLHLWADVFEQQARALRSGPGGGNFRQQIQRAYVRLVRRYHGWVSRRAFGCAQAITPDWAEVRVRAPWLGASDAALQAELKAWADSASGVVEQLARLQARLDLEDTRMTI